MRTDQNEQEADKRVTFSSDVNQHVYSYLDFFLARDKKPNFAVLVNGSWGIGKTFLVRRYLDARAKDTSKRYLYVSLYGLASAEEINDAVVEALYPMVANKGLKVAGKLAASIVGKVLIDLPEVKYADLVDQFGKMTILFDDLERCKLNPGIVLGYINRYVEHDECSVIILANEAEIKEDDYARVKEKVVGKTLAIIPSFGEALDAFITQIANTKLRDFLLSQRTDIEAIYQTSRTQNLRILFQVLLDYERVWESIDSKYRSHGKAMAAVLQLLAALSFELKSSAIKAEDLIGRHLNWLTALIRDSEAELTPWQAVCRKYPTADLQGALLSDEVLTNVLVRGEIKSDEINECLALSSFFVGHAEPAWRTLWYKSYRTEEACTKALKEFDEEFRARAFTDPGIALHAFGLKLMLADMGLGTGDRSHAVAECNTYIDDLEASGKLRPLKPGTHYAYDTGYQGLGFSEWEMPDFKELLTVFIRRQHKVYETQMPEAADALLIDMEANPDLFWRRINFNNIGDELYADVPIFATYDVQVFSDKLLTLEPSHLNSVVMALAARYERDTLANTLQSEMPWLQDLCRVLTERSATLPPFTNHRVNALVKHYLAPKVKLSS